MKTPRERYHTFTGALNRIRKQSQDRLNTIQILLRGDNIMRALGAIGMDAFICGDVDTAICCDILITHVSFQLLRNWLKEYGEA